MSDYTVEYQYMKQVIIEKFNNGELDTDALNRMINRCHDLGYFNGRLDGEKYATNTNIMRG